MFKHFKKLASYGLLFLLFTMSSALAYPAQEKKHHRSKNLWQTLIKHLRFDDYAYAYPVRQKIRWYLNHRKDIRHLTKKALPYLYYIYQETQRRGMPAEIALLPMIESGYQPCARSSAGAVGLWQMMPVTAQDFGLRMTPWYDGRRDIIASTNAALNYLQYLHAFFHNWLLAIAAYNSGQGTVLNAIHYNQRHNLPIDFWSLPLPRQTKRYVPKILAIAYLIKHMNYFNIHPIPVGNRPFFSGIIIDFPISLYQIAKLAHCSRRMIRRLNPQFKKRKTNTYRRYEILVPAKQNKLFQHDLREWLDGQTMTYIVQNGDTLYGIAHHFKMSIHELIEMNHLHTALIRPGQLLVVPVR